MPIVSLTLYFTQGYYNFPLNLPGGLTSASSSRGGNDSEEKSEQGRSEVKKVKIKKIKTSERQKWAYTKISVCRKRRWGRHVCLSYIHTSCQTSVTKRHVKTNVRDADVYFSLRAATFYWRWRSGWRHWTEFELISHISWRVKSKTLILIMCNEITIHNNSVVVDKYLFKYT